MENLSPTQQTAYAYWQSLDPEEWKPLRENFDPFAIPSVLPSVVLARVIDGGIDFQFRIIGQDVRDRLTGNYSGKCLSEFSDQKNRTGLWRAYQTVAETNRPHRVRLEYIGPYRNISYADELMLPFFDAAGLLHSILVIVTFDSPGRPPAPNA